MTGARPDEAHDAEVFDPPIALAVCRNDSGRYVFFNEVTGADGLRRRDYFGEGLYDLRVEGEFYQPVVMSAVRLPTAGLAVPIELRPGYRYPFSGTRAPGNGPQPALIRGSVLDAGGQGIAEARVEAKGAGPSPSYLTDATGQFVLVVEPGVGLAAIDLEITHPAAGGKVSVAHVPLAPGGMTSVPVTRAAGRVLDAAGKELAGAFIIAAGRAGAARSGPDGRWRYTFPLDQKPGRVRMSGTLPGGERLEDQTVTVVPGETASGPDFRSSAR